MVDESAGLVAALASKLSENGTGEPGLAFVDSVKQYSGVATLDGRVAAVRAFNRFYTGRLGVLREGFLQTPYSLTEARVLYELAQAERRDVRELRLAIDVDAGYLSRILRRFDEAGLVTRRRSPEDRRRQVVGLTAHGRAAFRVLDERSSAEAETLLGGLAEEEQRQLLAAMATVRALLGDPGPPAEAVLRAPRPGELGWVVERHGALYALEYGWDERFEALVARIVADYLAEHDPMRERCWIAETDERPAGCVFCVRKNDRVAQLRLLLVEPWARGRALGRLLVEECISFARKAGYAELTLWTNDVLVGARRIYERAGFQLVDETPHQSFGRQLIGQTWTLSL